MTEKSAKEEMMTAIAEFKAAAEDKRAMLFELLQLQEQLKDVIASDRKSALAARQIDLQVAHEAAMDRMRVADMRYDAYKILVNTEQQVAGFGAVMEKMYGMGKEEEKNAVR